MRSGKLRHRVSIDERVTTQDSAGGPLIRWVPRGAVFAQINPIRGREALLAGELIATTDTRVTVRWSSLTALIKSDWRLRCGSTVYSISAPPAEKNLGRKEIEILCKAGSTADLGSFSAG